MLIWRGRGIWVPLIFIGVLLATSLAVDAIFGEGFYTNQFWPKALAIGIMAVLLAAVGYFFNHKKRQVIVDPVSGVRRKSPSHTFFYIPIEYWSIIVLAFFAFMGYQDATEKSKRLLLLESPAVDDKYSVDLTKITEYSDGNYKYALLKVVSVTPEGVELVASNKVYDKKNGVQQDIVNGNAKSPAYYSDKRLFMDKQRLLGMHNNGGIFRVSRGML